LGLGACGTGAGPTATIAAPPTTPAPYTLPPVPSDPPITISAPGEVAAGEGFEAGWTGQETKGDFFVIVPAGSTTWTETPQSPYFNVSMGNPTALIAPAAPGEYEIWFLKGQLDTRIVIKARAPLTVT
jgi:hypothetical protein